MEVSLDVWREFFRTTDTDVLDFIDKAIRIAALDCPKDFLSRREGIAEQLFLCGMTPAEDDCAAASKESKANSNRDNAAHDGPFRDDIAETSLVFGEVKSIKRILDNYPHESDSALHESLKRLQSMTINVDILEKTKIGISVNNLRRNCRSKHNARLAHNITMGWKAMVENMCRSTEEDAADPHKVGDGTSSIKNQNMGKPGQKKYDFNGTGSLTNRNRRLQHQGTMKHNMSSNTYSRTIPASQIASHKFAKERMLQLQNSNESVPRCKRSLTSSRLEKIKGWNQVVADIKFAGTKRKLQELYQKVDTDKRRRTVQVLDLRDLPKMATSHKAPWATIAKARQRRVVSHGRVSCV